MSIFSALQECCPGVIRNNASASGRRGITMIEFNKALEKHGFEKMRDRRTDAATRQDDPTGGHFPSYSTPALTKKSLFCACARVSKTSPDMLCRRH